MSALCFTQNEPAGDVTELVSYLQDQHRDGFVYRGETQLWPGPLFPSAFRPYRATGQVYRRPDTLPFPSRKNAGQTFIGLEPLNYLWEFADRYCPSCKLSQPELREIDRLIDDLGFSQVLGNSRRMADSIAQAVSVEIHEAFSSHYEAWEKVIDLSHKNRIRQLVCLNAFGFVLGMAIAQHYDFSSEALDVTHDPIVAAFFATHEARSYAGPKNDGIGLIYRFQVSEQDRKQPNWQDMDFFSAGCYADMLTILATFFGESYGQHDSLQNLINHVYAALEGGRGGRRSHQIRISQEVVSQTRVARQRGALLIPDLLLKADTIAGMTVRRFLAVEDLRDRAGTECFFFRHSPCAWRYSDITRECLWPEQDVFREMFDYVLSSSSTMVFHPSGMVLPKRRDLVKQGYDS